MNYILKDKTPVLCKDILEWARWMETADRRVAVTKISDSVEVFTVFLGIDYNLGGRFPMLFETMIFGGTEGNSEWLFATWVEAEEWHKVVCESLQPAPIKKVFRNGTKQNMRKIIVLTKKVK